MPEKTLKEKVEMARKAVEQMFDCDWPDVHKYVPEALAALEDRVKELEAERTLVEKWANDYFYGDNGYQSFLAGLKKKEALDDGGK